MLTYMICPLLREIRKISTHLPLGAGEPLNSSASRISVVFSTLPYFSLREEKRRRNYFEIPVHLLSLSSGTK